MGPTTLGTPTTVTAQQPPHIAVASSSCMASGSQPLLGGGLQPRTSWQEALGDMLAFEEELVQKDFNSFDYESFA